MTNTDQVESYFRYPDLTQQAVYLIHTLNRTIEEDMPEELLFIQRYESAKKALQGIVDMPDKLINLMLIFLHQNKGMFPKGRRQTLKMLTDDEIDRMQQTYQGIYQLQ